MFSQYTDFCPLPLHCVPFWDEVRSVSFWWQDKYPMRDTGCAEGKRMYLTSKNQNASTVRKVLAGLRVRRNEGDEEMW